MALVRLVRRTNQIRVNVKPAADAMGVAIVGMMKARDRAGVGADGSPLPEYSPLYRQQLAAIGESTRVDISRSRRLLDDLRVLQVEIASAVATLIFGVGGGTSPRTPRPPPAVFSPKLTAAQQARALERWKRSTKKVEQSLPHPQLLETLIVGGVGRPARNLLGLTAEERRKIVRDVIEPAKIFTYG